MKKLLLTIPWLLIGCGASDNGAPAPSLGPSSSTGGQSSVVAEVGGSGSATGAGGQGVLGTGGSSSTACDATVTIPTGCTSISCKGGVWICGLAAGGSASTGGNVATGGGWIIDVGTGGGRAIDILTGGAATVATGGRTATGGGSSTGGASGTGGSPGTGGAPACPVGTIGCPCRTSRIYCDSGGLNPAECIVYQDHGGTTMCVYVVNAQGKDCRPNRLLDTNNGTLSCELLAN